MLNICVRPVYLLSSAGFGETHGPLHFSPWISDGTAQVYLAQQTVGDGEGEEGGNTIRRAVKMLRGGASNTDKEEFLHEASIMLDLEHDNLVRVSGTGEKTANVNIGKKSRQHRLLFTFASGLFLFPDPYNCRSSADFSSSLSLSMFLCLGCSWWVWWSSSGRG